MFGLSLQTIIKELLQKAPMHFYLPSIFIGSLLQNSTTTNWMINQACSKSYTKIKYL